jgi:hypothetical protein
VYSIKVPVALIEDVDRTLVRFVHTRRQAPISRNEFIRQAIEAKLDHLRRSSSPRRRRSSGGGTLSGGGNTAPGGNGPAHEPSSVTQRHYPLQQESA